uniref:Uncharacterized protein n=1 Tax=Setaria italica TaxID=4555 RepID=K3YXP4_SETIT
MEMQKVVQSGPNKIEGYTFCSYNISQAKGHKDNVSNKVIL